MGAGASGETESYGTLAGQGAPVTHGGGPSNAAARADAVRSAPFVACRAIKRRPVACPDPASLERTLSL